MTLHKKILHRLGRMKYGRETVPCTLPIIKRDDLNNLIKAKLLAEGSCMVARYGYGELTAAQYDYITRLPFYRRWSLFAKKRIPFTGKDSEVLKDVMRGLCVNAGFFPNDSSLLHRYSKLLIEDSSQLDILGLFFKNEDIFEKFFSDNIKFSKLEWMEPYDYATPWSKALEGKKVLVVHPLAETIQVQYERRELLWENKDVLPKFDLKTIKAVQSIGGECEDFKDWFEALDYMKAQMDATDYDVAIIGCGAYGFHLAAHAKRTGHKAIHLGGATQILFGIKGKRWDELPAVSKFYNKHWVYPSEKDRPKAFKNVEGGCYW